jgi:hypothetical protein
MRSMTMLLKAVGSDEKRNNDLAHTVGVPVAAGLAKLHFGTKPITRETRDV